jgi:predicted neuraminidase
VGATAAVAGSVRAAGAPRFDSELVFPLEHWHNHSSSIVELPGGDLLVCWYNGSGERSADDVRILAARRPRGARRWRARFELADTPGFPDTNPILFVDSRERLWLIWPAILANRWETALLKFRVAPARFKDGAPPWARADNLLFIPLNFEARVREAAGAVLAQIPDGPQRDAARQTVEQAGDKYAARMGWMPRNHPLELPSGRLLVPLYSDGFDFSLVAISDHGGATWTTSEPLVSAGGVQPSLVRRRDGTIVAYMRDNGPPPKRVLTSESRDSGVTWSPVIDSDLPNPGSSLEVIALHDGSWLMVGNDTERGRHSLLAQLSDDEGRTWKWRRHIERDERISGAASFHYPSVIQAKDGTIHVTYSYFLNHLPEGAPRKAIKHAWFDAAWVKAGTP